MANSGAVYQPTTVTYDGDSGFPQGDGQTARRWSSTGANRRTSAPVSYLARAALQQHTCCTLPSRRTLATLYCSSSAASAAIGLTLIVHGAIACCDSGSVYVTVIVIGVLTMLLSAALLMLYLRHTRRCCFMMSRKETRLGVPCTLQPCANVQLNNPSTDHLLVSAQPTAQTPEHAHLMPKGAPPEDDPRILLRPLDAAHNIDDNGT